MAAIAGEVIETIEDNVLWVAALLLVFALA
jgi:hypothetical protein